VDSDPARWGADANQPGHRAVTTEAGEVTGYVSIAFDITERRQMLVT